MLDKLKYIYSSVRAENFKVLRFIPDRMLFGSSYGKFKKEISFVKTTNVKKSCTGGILVKNY